jgi:hypothetical protein
MPDKRLRRAVRVALFAVVVGAVVLVGYGIGYATSKNNGASPAPATNAATAPPNGDITTAPNDAAAATAAPDGDEATASSDSTAAPSVGNSNNSLVYENAGSLPPIVPDADAWPDADVAYSCQPSSVHPTDGQFRFSSGNLAVDAAYNLAMCEVNENVQDGIFIAGNGWTQLWTRDTAFAVEQAAGLLRPDVSLRSLEKCVEEWPIEETIYANKTVWYQDVCGHFGCVSDM